jgi:hypothetical protein
MKEINMRKQSQEDRPRRDAGVVVPGIIVQEITVEIITLEAPTGSDHWMEVVDKRERVPSST